MENIIKLLLSIPDNSLEGYKIQMGRSDIFNVLNINSNGTLYGHYDDEDETDEAHDLETNEIPDDEIKKLIKFINFNIIKK